MDRSVPGGLSRRSFLIVTACGFIGRSRVAKASDQTIDWPPVLETERSQFTVTTPRTRSIPFEVRDLAGRAKSIVPGRGQVMLVNLWATWCAACRPDLKRLANLDRMHKPGLAIVPICTDTWDAREIQGFLVENEATGLTSYMDPTGRVANDRNPPGALFPAPKIPITYLIGKSGLTEGYVAGPAEWTSKAGLNLLHYYLDQS